MPAKRTDKTAKRSSDRPSAHAVPKPMQEHGTRVVNGRIVGPTLADPGMDAAVKKAVKELFPNREAALKYFQKRGVLTKGGKLTKAYGG